jgi:hypothetical protein
MRDGYACTERHQAVVFRPAHRERTSYREYERDASVRIRRHHTFALPPVRETLPCECGGTVMN